MGILTSTAKFSTFLTILLLIYVNKCNGDKDNQTRMLTASHAAIFLRANLVPKYFETLFEDWNRTLASHLSLLKGLSELCREHYLGWLTNIQDNYDDLSHVDSWALQMLDSWGKAPEGLLSGHITAMGDFDECLNIRKGLTDKLTFKGKYCTNFLTFSDSKFRDQAPSINNVSFKLPQNEDIRSISELYELLNVLSKTETSITPSVASCLPSTCSDSDVQIIIGAVFSSSNVTNNYVYPITVSCSTDHKPLLSAGSISMIVILVVLVTLLITGSLLDILGRYGYVPWDSGIEIVDIPHKTGKARQILLTFSIPKNTKKLLNTKTPPGSFGCLHGIRFISATWVILGHTFYMHILQSVWNLVDLVQTTQDDVLLLVVLNGGFVVDTFLTVSGVLVAFNVLKALDKSNGKLNIPLLYLSRYLRLTPMYAFVIGFAATLFPYLSSGPKWFVVEAWAQFCQKNWWKNLLYVNNLPIYNDTALDSVDKLCYGESWYLGADMQLFIISPLFLYPLWKWETVGRILLSIITVMSIILPITITYVNNLLPTSLPFRALGNFTHQSYMATWMRASPYLMGLWTGYFLHKTQRSHFKIPKLIQLGCWVISTSVALTLLLGIHKYYNWRYEIPRLEGAMYAGFHHSIWGVCIGWVIFACVRGYGGWVNDFLSWKVFIPLGRLTYAIYLVSFHLQFLLHFSYRQPIYYSGYNAVNISFSHLIMCCIVAFILSIAMESPFMELEKMVLKKKDSGTDSKERLTGLAGCANYGAREA